jgi:hypothetical protein
VISATQNRYDTLSSTSRGGRMASGCRKLAPDRFCSEVTVFAFSALFAVLVIHDGMVFFLICGFGGARDCLDELATTG